MTSEWRPRSTTPEEDAQAVAVAVGAGIAVGAVTFWLVRTFLGRDAIDLEPPPTERALEPPVEPGRIGPGPS